MGAEGDGRISANIGAERKNRVRQFADERFDGSLTAVVNTALDALLEEEARERASVSASVLESIGYLRLITNTGNSASDWNIIKQEVEKLWQSMPSLS